MISLSEGELVNWRVMHPSILDMKEQDIIHFPAMKRMIHLHMMIPGHALLLGSIPEGAQMRLYLKVSLSLDDVEANRPKLAASHRFPYPLKTRAPPSESFMMCRLFGMARILIIKQNHTLNCFEVGYRRPGPKRPKQG